MSNIPDSIITYILVPNFVIILNIFILILQHLFYLCILHYLLMVHDKSYIISTLLCLIKQVINKLLIRQQVCKLYYNYSRYYFIFIVLELTQNDLVTYVAPHVTTKLQKIVTVLALTPPELNDIEMNHQGITGVFQLWFETKRCPYTWDTLLMILKSPAVNEPELSNQLTW